MSSLLGFRGREDIGVQFLPLFCRLIALFFLNEITVQYINCHSVPPWSCPNMEVEN